jgi:hypothetical protein
MTQLAVNMKHTTQNKHFRKLKINRFKMRYTPYANQCSQYKKNKIEH